MSSTDTIHFTLLVHCEGKNELALACAVILYKTSFTAIHFLLLMHAEQKVSRLPHGPTMLCETSFAAFHLMLLMRVEWKLVGIHRMRKEGVGSIELQCRKIVHIWISVTIPSVLRWSPFSAVRATLGRPKHRPAGR